MFQDRDPRIKEARRLLWEVTWEQRKLEKKQTAHKSFISQLLVEELEGVLSDAQLLILYGDYEDGSDNGAIQRFKKILTARINAIKKQ